MAHTLFGPWHLTAEEPQSDAVEEAFTIAGSDSADGFYVVPPAGAVALTVTGQQWNIEFHATPYPDDWVTYDAERTTSFDGEAGLTVRFTAPPDTFSGVAHPPSVVVTCVCADPTINPPPQPNPYDFTLPKP